MRKHQTPGLWGRGQAGLGPGMVGLGELGVWGLTYLGVLGFRRLRSCSLGVWKFLAFGGSWGLEHVTGLIGLGSRSPAVVPAGRAQDCGREETLAPLAPTLAEGSWKLLEGTCSYSPSCPPGTH